MPLCIECDSFQVAFTAQSGIHLYPIDGLQADLLPGRRPSCETVTAGEAIITSANELLGTVIDPVCVFVCTVGLVSTAKIITRFH